MKLIKKSIIVLLSIFTAAQSCAFCAAAADNTSDSSAIVGDVDGDGLVTVVDATLIQKYSAQLIGDNDLNITAADVNLNDQINVDDATKVQIYSAGLPDSSYAGMNVSEAVQKKKSSGNPIETPIR